MENDIEDILRNHEKRISRLEANTDNINGWLKGIDTKLDKLSEDIAYMKGKLNNSKKPSSKKTLYTLIATQATTIFLLAMVLSKVI